MRRAGSDPGPDSVMASGASRPVSRVLDGRDCSRRDGHSSGTRIAARLEQPTRTTRPQKQAPLAFRREHRPYSVLLPVGLAMPSPLPGPRCALTAPFHPYLSSQLALLRHGEPGGLSRRSPEDEGGRFDLCGAFPGVAPAGRYPAPCFRGARTFLPRKNGFSRERPSGRLAEGLVRAVPAPVKRDAVQLRAVIVRTLAQ